MSNMKYGPQTYQIEKLLIKIKSLTPEQIENLYAARSAAWDAARSAAWSAAWYAALALVSRDLIGEKFTQAHYDLLTKPWRDVIGEFEEPLIETKEEPKPLLPYETIYQWLGIDVITKTEARKLLGVENHL